MKTRYYVFFAIFVSFIAIAGKQVNLKEIRWVKYSDENNIQVYEATEAHSSGLIPIKVHTVLDHPITKVITVLSDASRKSEWVPRIETSKTVEQIGFGEFIDYASFDAPWPFSDRDFLVHIKTNYDLAKKEVRATIYSVEHKKMPNQKRFVRGYTYSGNTYLKSIENDTKTYVEMSFFNDYRGKIPKWIVNMVQLTWPRDFIDQLRTQLAKSDVRDKIKSLDMVKQYIQKKSIKLISRKTAGKENKVSN